LPVFLSLILGISPANLNTFSNANRTRNPSVMEKFFWMMYDHFKSQNDSFIKAKHKTPYKQSERGIVFVVREKETMQHKVVKSVAEEDLAKNIIADETILLTGIKTKDSYSDVLWQ
jgi:hypothetical protein